MLKPLAEILLPMLRGGSKKQFKIRYKKIHKLLGLPNEHYIPASLAWCSVVTTMDTHPHTVCMPSALPPAAKTRGLCNLWRIHTSTEEKGVREGAEERNFNALNVFHIAALLKGQSVTCGKNTEFLSLNLLIFQIKFTELASYRLFNFCHKTLSQHYRNKARLSGLGGRMNLTEVPISL